MIPLIDHNPPDVTAMLLCVDQDVTYFYDVAFFYSDKCVIEVLRCFIFSFKIKYKEIKPSRIDSLPYE